MADAIDIKVDLDALQQLVTQLTSISTTLKQYKTDLTGYASATGSSKVRSELESFASGWKDGRGKIEDNADKLVGKVKGVAQTYSDQENSLAKQSQVKK